MAKILAILLSLSVALPAFAHESHKPAVEIEFSASPVKLADSDVQSLIHQSHELIEGEESGNFINRWRDAFDFKTRIVDGLRWSASVDDKKFRNLAIDSLFLFGLSHGTEMLSGPVLLGVGYAHEWPTWAMSSIASGGTLISIPGLDPLCMVAFAFFAKSEKFRSSIGWLRLGVARGFGKFVRAAAISDFIAKIFSKPDVKEYLEKLEGLKSVNAEEDGIVDFTYALVAPSGETAIEAAVHYENGLSSLESVTLSQAALAGIDPGEIKRFTRQFGWNARDFIKSAMRKELLQKPYILEAKPGFYRLKPNAIGIQAKRTCADRLIP